MIVVEGARLLRDKRSGETLKSRSGKGLTGCPAESEQPETEINIIQKYQWNFYGATSLVYTSTN
ncbi:hypothetical protein QUF49_19990 [Fictibacillus sp. b24]|uniref:hypothetical protein n=1 Tax=Fictibacillus sp. b24 TaxID=3055863 RepID=UPI0025A27900|nr:hypothetical protein [Fictibacillus sp. b24]MDM5318266.1 hypothetical protein [Fictibacillus sp. b24]